MAGALRHARVERGDPHGLVLDACERMDDQLAYDKRGLVPTGGAVIRCQRPMRLSYRESSSSNALASRRSAVSKPSVNQP
jgi:hypothetical protein